MGARWGWCGGLLVLWLGGCADTAYAPGLVARSELTVRVRRGRIEMWDSQGKVDQETYSAFTSWPRLAGRVRCVPKAHQHARTARNLSIASGVVHTAGLGLLTIGSLFVWGDLGVRFGFYPWRAQSLVPILASLPLFPIGVAFRNHANGHAVDALNYYNDAVGSLGGSCEDPRLPRPTVVIPPREEVGGGRP